MTSRFFTATVLAAAGLAVSAGARASTVTFDSIGDSASFTYAAAVDGANLNGTVSYQLTSWSGSTAIFHVSATNSSTGAGSGLNPNRLVSFGVGIVNPDLVGASVPGVTEWDATTNTNFPGFGTVELCNYAGSTCAGGAGLGVFVGTTDVFDLTLNFVSAVGASSPITFSSPFSSKWQNVGVNGGSFEVSGCLAGDTACTTTTVPEPTSIALSGLALIAAAAAMRRRRA